MSKPSINSKVFEKFVRATNVSPLELSKTTGIRVHKLKSLRKGDNKASNLTANELRKLADAFCVPVFAFYSPEFELPETGLLDFRDKNPKEITGFGALGKMVQKVNSLQDYILQLRELNEDTFPTYLDFSNTNAPEQAAQAFAANLGIGEKMRESSKYSYEYYSKIRYSIEKVGICVYHDSLKDTKIRGAALVDEDRRAPLIWINTNSQNTGSRIFTMAHELAHIAFGHAGISNPYVQKNSIETQCNQFAASLLMPRDEFLQTFEKLRGMRRRVDNDLIRRLANKFFISQHASIIRLINLGEIDHEFLVEWLGQFKGKLLPESEPDFARSKEYNAGSRKLSQFGFGITKAILESVEKREISKVEIFDYLSLKPKYQSQMLEAYKDKVSDLESMKH